MKSFKQHRGIVALLDAANVDTDQIIPKQFLKSIKRTGFGESLFFDWRRLPDGRPNPDFSLNDPKFKDASILVTRNNFGCGSSREHAVWAIQQYGFKVVIAPWKETPNGRPGGRASPPAGRVPAFADIFKNNSVKNALLCVELSEAEVEEIFREVGRGNRVEATVDLENHRVTLHAKEEVAFRFEMDPDARKRLLHGLDDIGLTLQHEKEISNFETRHSPQLS